ncbi:hypothetical protein ABFY09_10555 [Marinomonas sp. 5E14-1]|uniref:hypothetical protein n=1 Tax=Marinomonas sp. 5E14-1 TaxID=3153922 RepID=UPI0032630B92
MIIKIKFSDLLKEINPVLPSKINIEDGRFGSGIFRQLISEGDLAAERCACLTQLTDLHDRMVSAIFNGFHELARETLKTDEKEVNIEDIDLSYVEQRFSENIKYAEKKLRKSYVNDLASLGTYNLTGTGKI